MAERFAHALAVFENNRAIFVDAERLDATHLAIFAEDSRILPENYLLKDILCEMKLMAKETKESEVVKKEDIEYLVPLEQGDTEECNLN